MNADQLRGVVQQQDEKIQALTQQLEWFKRQIFGRKSERFIAEDPSQLHLGGVLAGVSAASEPPRQAVPAHTRRTPQRDAAADAEAESLPFFDESRVPVHTMQVLSPEIAALRPDQYEVIAEKVTYRLCQQPGAYSVIKYVRPVVKRLDTQAISCSPPPLGVIESSRAYVSFVAGLLVDKFAYHLPLYRQHQRLTDSGITVSRPWLTQLAQKGIGLLVPIYEAQLVSIRASRVLSMDETPIKASPDGKGGMKTGYFWPIYGEQDEVCFPYFPTREHDNVRTALGLKQSGGVLLSDGYAAYKSYAKRTGQTHAQCWAHVRREFFEAHEYVPEAKGALEQIQVLYDIEEQIRKHKLAGESKRLHRLMHSKPRVELFFKWIEEQLERYGLLPNDPLAKALGYARERRDALEVFLTDPEVPMGRVSDWRVEHALRGVAVVRQAGASVRATYSVSSRCSSNRTCRFPASGSHARVFRPSLSSRLHDFQVVGRGRASCIDTRLGIGGTLCPASLVAVSASAEGVLQCSVARFGRFEPLFPD